MRINKHDGGGQNSSRSGGGCWVNDGTQTETRSLFTQLRSGPKGRFRQGNAAVRQSVHCWEKTRHYEEGGNGSDDQTRRRNNQPGASPLSISPFVHITGAVLSTAASMAFGPKQSQSRGRGASAGCSWTS